MLSQLAVADVPLAMSLSLFIKKILKHTNITSVEKCLDSSFIEFITKVLRADERTSNILRITSVFS